MDSRQRKQARDQRALIDEGREWRKQRDDLERRLADAQAVGEKARAAAQEEARAEVARVEALAAQREAAAEARAQQAEALTAKAEAQMAEMGRELIVANRRANKVEDDALELPRTRERLRKRQEELDQAHREIRVLRAEIVKLGEASQHLAARLHEAVHGVAPQHRVGAVVSGTEPLASLASVAPIAVPEPVMASAVLPDAQPAVAP